MYHSPKTKLLLLHPFDLQLSVGRPVLNIECQLSRYGDHVKTQGAISLTGLLIAQDVYELLLHLKKERLGKSGKRLTIIISG